MNYLDDVNAACKNQNFNQMLLIAKEQNKGYLGMFLSTILLRKRTDNKEELMKYYNYFKQLIETKDDDLPVIIEEKTDYTIKLLCNWCSSDEISAEWSKMIPSNSSIKLLTSEDGDEEPDYYVILNCPLKIDKFIPEKTIIFQMEPNMKDKKVWKEWASPDPTKFLRIFDHTSTYNNLEWHLKQSYEQLSNTHSQKTKVLSTILSEKYFDEGHIKRVDFVKHIENNIQINVYGSNLYSYNNYISPLPKYNKDEGLLPYKYTFTAENNSIPNYFTEKIVDAILSECLCFYWGCPNLEEYIDSQAFIRLDLNDMDASMKIVRQAIENNEWSKRIDAIRREKTKILDELQFFPRLERILKEI